MEQTKVTCYSPRWVALSGVRGGCTLIDEIDWELATAQSMSFTKYVRARGTYLHRLIARPPTGYEVDHKNHDTRDNRRSNLRVVTKKQNQANKRTYTYAKHSRFKGVTWKEPNKRWQAQIRIDGRQTYIGMFDDEEAAAHAYDAVAREEFGQHAFVNFPDERMLWGKSK